MTHDKTTAADDPSRHTIILLENEIALGRRYGMAGQTLGAMCSARDEIERLSRIEAAARTAASHGSAQASGAIRRLQEELNR